jgi:hypothetical protein
MNERVKVTIKVGQSDSDFQKFQNIIEGMKDFKPNIPADTEDKEAEAKRQFKAELQRRIIEAGLG